MDNVYTIALSYAISNWKYIKTHLQEVADVHKEVFAKEGYSNVDLIKYDNFFDMMREEGILSILSIMTYCADKDDYFLYVTYLVTLVISGTCSFIVHEPDEDELDELDDINAFANTLVEFGWLEHQKHLDPGNKVRSFLLEDASHRSAKSKIIVCNAPGRYYGLVIDRKSHLRVFYMLERAEGYAYKCVFSHIRAHRSEKRMMEVRW